MRVTFRANNTRTATSKATIANMGKLNVPGAKPIWQFGYPESMALAVCQNAVVVAKQDSLEVLNLTDGKVLWSQPLPTRPVEWGIAVNARGQIIVTLENEQVLCFG